jgi:hypothetical protein
LAIALVLVFLVFGMSGQSIGLISLYLLLSSSLPLGLGSGAAFLAFRSFLEIRHKVALAGAVGSVVALVNVLFTAREVGHFSMLIGNVFELARLTRGHWSCTSSPGQGAGKHDSPGGGACPGYQQPQDDTGAGAG